MASAEERLKILTLIQEGKISAEEGIRLLDSLEAGQAAEPSRPGAAEPRRARWLRVCVTDTNTDKTRVNIRLPITVLSAGVKMGARFTPEVEGLDINQLMDFVNSGTVGKIVDVFDEEDGEHVEVFLE
ncbi:MAG TPA: hypothetical protein GYA06_09660 [Chloroflexi bacterium]|nr:hypothetical protein [Chloroflexota bacterium]HPO57452.1 hypothetical protein [Anaerolineaceae bacterium]